MIPTSRIPPTRGATTSTAWWSRPPVAREAAALTARQTITVTVTDENERPAFTSQDTFEVKENVRVAGRVDRPGRRCRDDAVTGYEVAGGADGSRLRDRQHQRAALQGESRREARLRAAVGFRGDNEYNVLVEAGGGTDTRKLTATQAVTVTVEDVDEPPGQPDPPTVSDETESSLTVSWDEPANTGHRHLQLPRAVPLHRRLHRLARQRRGPEPHAHRPALRSGPTKSRCKPKTTRGKDRGPIRAAGPPSPRRRSPASPSPRHHLRGRTTPTRRTT